MSYYWTSAEEETLRTLWLKGLPASRIALEMGLVSRNAVIGKLNRLGMRRKGEGENKYVSNRSVERKYKPRVPSVWTQALDAKLIQLWTAGVLVKDIAEALGVTPSAVGNRAYTLRLPPRTVQPKKATPAVVKVLEVILPPGPPLTMLLTRKPFGECAFIEGGVKGPETAMCGHPVKGAGSWCPYHSRLVYVPRRAA